MPETEKPKGCAVKGLLLFLVALLALNVAVASFLLFLALSSSPLEVPFQKVDNGAFLTASSKIQALPGRIKASVPGEVDCLQLSESEFNALLSACLNANGFAGKQLDKLPVKSLTLRLKDGAFLLSFSKDIGFWTPFGSWLNANAKLKMELPERGQERTDVLHCKLGRLGIPVWLAQLLVDLNSRKLPEDGDLRRIVISMKAEKGLLEIKYHPCELKRLIESKIDSAPPMLKGLWNML